METVCGFYTVNGKHCVLTDHCIVCKLPTGPKLEKGQIITLENFGAADGQYKITNLKNGTLSLEYIK